MRRSASIRLTDRAIQVATPSGKGASMLQGKPAMYASSTASNVSTGFSIVARAFLCVFAFVFLSSSLHAQLRPPVTNQRTTPVFLPAPRELMRELTQAVRDIEAKEYVDAITRLDFILNGDESNPEEFSEDYFLRGRKGKPRTSLKQEADRLISTLPEKGREAYELAYGTDAAKQLEQAVERRDYEAIKNIARQYGNTNAGEEATLLLGHRQLLNGNSLEALLHFQRLARSEHAKQRFGSELKLLNAAALQLAGRDELANKLLEDLEPNDTSVDPQAALAAILPEATERQSLFEWPMLGGNASRSAESAADMPMRTSAWEVPNVIGDTEGFKSLSDLAKSKRSTGAVPAVHPLLVGDIVLARTTGELVGASMKHQLRRQWMYPFPDANDERTLTVARREARMKQRLWENSLYGQVSSDGQYVYLISSIPDSLGGRSNTVLTNTLVALELESQGKLKWIVGKDDADHEPALRGMFFLGAPLPIGDSLFCVGEQNSEIRVMELDKLTGKLLWSQQLAHVEQRSRYTRSDLRRLSGVNLAYADGILICPTSTGGAIGIELSQKRLVWGYEYPTRVPMGNPRLQTTVSGSWRDNWAVIDKGRVILSPWDSDELFCVDLLTGESLWDRKVARGSGLYVAGVHKESVIVVGKNEVSALNLKNGNAVWKRALRGSASGRGIKTDSHYLLATSKPELVKIDLDTGQIVESLPTKDPLGNLIASEDMIIAQNSLWLRAFYQQDKLQQKVARRLADNPKDPWALEHAGYLLLDKGKRTEGLQQLRHAVDNYPTLETPGLDYLAKKRLVDETFEMLLTEQGRDVLDMADSIRRYLPDERRSEYLRVMTELNLKEGRIPEAFESNLALFLDSLGNASRTLVLPELTEIGERKIRPDRWHRSMFRSIWKMANQVQQDQLASSLVDRLEQIQDSRELEPMQKEMRRASVIEVTQDLPVMHLPYLDLLATKFEAKGKVPYVEGPLYRLSQSDRADVAGRATGLLARLYRVSGQTLAAAGQYIRLRDEFGDVDVEPGKTGVDVLERDMADNAGLKAYLASRDRLRWGYGTLKAKSEKADEVPRNAAPYGFTRNTDSLNGYSGIDSEHGPIWDSGMQWVVSQGIGSPLEIRDPFGQTVASIGSMFSNSSRGRRPKLRTLGHLAVGVYDNSLVALNGLRDPSQALAGSTELWRDFRSGVVSAAGLPVREAKFGQLGLSRRMEYGPNGRSPVSLGVVSDRGVVFRRSGDLICVEPGTGETLWQRDDLAVEAEVWGDDEFVFAHVDEKFGGGNARVFSIFDGSELESRPAPDQGNRLRTFGRHVLSWRKDVGQSFSLDLDPNQVVDDILKAKDPPKPEPRQDAQRQRRKPGPKQGTAFRHVFEMRNLFNRSRRFEWSRTYGDRAKACWVSRTELAVFDPIDGKFEIISVLDGKSKVLYTIDTDLVRVDTLEVKRQAGLYVVMLGQNSDGTVDSDVRYKSPIAIRSLQNLEVYAFSPEGDMVWGVPAILKNFRHLPAYAEGIPLLLFARKHVADANRSKRSFETVALDVRDGHVAFQDIGVFQGRSKFKLSGRHGEQLVDLLLPSENGKWSLTFTDTPRAPTVPYGYELERSAKRGGGLSTFFKYLPRPKRPVPAHGGR